MMNRLAAIGLIANDPAVVVKNTQTSIFHMHSDYMCATPG